MPERTEPVSDGIHEALRRWAGLENATVEPLPGGLVNTTYRVRTPDADYVAQRVNPIFSRRIHENVRAVTRHLADRGVTTIELVPTRDGSLFVDLDDGGCVRLLVRMPGETFEVCGSSAQARSAGAAIGRFHDALDDFRAPLHPLGFPFHETDRHLADLRDALARHPEHARHADVAALAARIFEVAASWPDETALPQRVVHGDLKFSNVLFAGAAAPDCEHATALIDLDTLCRLPLYYDLGDAWRSWCNRRGEDSAEAELCVSIFESSAEGYLSARPHAPARGELISFAHAIERLSIELSARFAADVLQEDYFDWDRARFASAAEHNWIRAEGQWSLYEQARATRDERLRFLLG